MGGGSPCTFEKDKFPVRPLVGGVDVRRQALPELVDLHGVALLHLVVPQAPEPAVLQAKNPLDILPHRGPMERVICGIGQSERSKRHRGGGSRKFLLISDPRPPHSVQASDHLEPGTLKGQADRYTEGQTYRETDGLVTFSNVQFKDQRHQNGFFFWWVTHTNTRPP